jgi:uncharacterized protein (TIRG00374 family)
LKKIITGLVLSVFLLLFFLWTSNLVEMIGFLQHANYFYMLPGFSAYIISLWLRSLRWSYLLSGKTQKLPANTLFPIVIIGYMANNILPFRAGEFVRSYLLSDKKRIKTATAFSSIFVERIMDGLTLIMFIFITSLFMPITNTMDRFAELSGISANLLTLLFSVPFVFLFLLLILIAMLGSKAEHIMIKISRPLPNRFRNIIVELTKQIFDGINGLANKKIVIVTILLSIPIWLLESLLFYFVGLSLGINENFASHFNLFSSLLIVTGLVNIGSSIPATPGGIGIFEVIARESLILMPNSSVTRGAAAAFAGLTHALLIIPVILLGQILLWRNGLKLFKISETES